MTPSVRVGVVALAIVLVAQSVAHAVAVFGFDSYNSIVDLNRNDGIPDVISTVAILAAALGAFRFGATARSGVGWSLGVVLAMVAVADVWHNGIESLDALGGAVALLLAAAAVLIICIARRSDRWTSRLLLGGLAALVCSVAITFAFRRAEAYIDVARGDVVYEVKIIVKQGLELAGWWLVALGLWEAVGDRAVRPALAFPAAHGGGRGGA